jgi:hypothetical protein
MRSIPTFMIFAFVLASPALAQAGPGGPADVRDVFARGFLVEDRNGDDVTDFVRTRIVLPVSPTVEEVAAAANIAARLGYETSALDMGIAARGETAFDVPVVIIGGRTSFEGAAIAGLWGGLLAAGEGAIGFIAPAGPLRAGGVAVDGGDATGLLAAAAYLAGRYPSVWGMRGTPLATVPERIGRYLVERGIVLEATTLDRVVVDAMRPGISRALVTVRLADADALADVLEALRARSAADSAAGAGRGGAGERGDTSRAGGGGGAAGDSAQTGDRGEGAPAEQDGQPVGRGDLDFEDLHRIDVRVLTPDTTAIVRLLPARPWQTRTGGEYTARDGTDFTLSDLYTIRGLFRDTNDDLVPDRTDAYLSLGGNLAAASVVDFAARVGLETAGMRLPFARAAGQDDHPATRGFPILYGAGHYRTDRLRESGMLHGGGAVPGEGSIEMVRKALDGRNGIVVTGGDSAGLAAITDFVATRLPYLSEYGKGNYRLADVETEVRRFFQVVETPGQIALAGHKLRTWLDRLAGSDVDSIAIEIAAKQPPAGLDQWAASLASTRFPSAHTSATTFRTGFGEGRTIFTQAFDIPWEVDAFRDVFTTSILPRLNADSRGRIEVRLSEPPDVRADLATGMRHQLEERGIAPDAFEIVVLSAYKQGYSWLYDEVLPRIRSALAADGDGELAVGRIEITYHTLRDSDEVRWQEIASDTRWLQEIFPVDAVLARELGIPDSAITFRATQRSAPVYTVRVLDTAGVEILSDAFDPKYVVRPYFDLFPEYESVRVTTGWVTAVANGDTLVDRRIVTDPERFWDVLQQDTYARIIEYVMDVQDGRPSPGNAPYYDEFRVELTLSEPDYRIGIDEEVISSLEALHEDIYFSTLQLFDLIGDRYGVGGLAYGGRVLPYIVPGGQGRPGRASITFTGKERGVPELVMTHRVRGEEPVRQRYPLSVLAVPDPMLRGITVRAGDTGLQRLLFEVTAIDSLDSYEANRLRANEPSIDRQLLPVELLAGMVDVMADLHRNGLAEDAVSFDRVAELVFRFTLQDTTVIYSRMATLPRSANPARTEHPKLLADGWAWSGERIVQWDSPMPPVENDSILAKLGTFPGVNVHWVTRSFLGQNVWAADFLPPHDATWISQAKLNALKPTVFLSGRQHANEVSSTSHILRLGELLATDSAHRELLKKVNVVLHPITNPDGARLAWEMQLINPDFMLHAGYLGALGVDATAGASANDPIYPESKARPWLQAMWLPDIYINMHGYPSHEWVQYFAGYSAWVRGRTGSQRSWWAPRGWFIPGFSWTEDPRYPEFQTAQFAVLDSIAAAITAEPEVEAMSRRMYERYAKYGRQDVDNFREHFHNGILVYQALRGRPVGGQGPANTRINYFSVTTEAPDETARGDWLDLVATAGLAHSSALVRYLATGQNRIERETAEFAEFVTRSVFRKKPVIPVQDEG